MAKGTLPRRGFSVVRYFLATIRGDLLRRGDTPHHHWDETGTDLSTMSHVPTSMPDATLSSPGRLDVGTIEAFRQGIPG